MSLCRSVESRQNGRITFKESPYKHRFKGGTPLFMHQKVKRCPVVADDNFLFRCIPACLAFPGDFFHNLSFQPAIKAQRCTNPTSNSPDKSSVNPFRKCTSRKSTNSWKTHRVVSPCFRVQVSKASRSGKSPARQGDTTLPRSPRRAIFSYS